MAKALVAALVVLALAGCSTAAVPREGLTADELATVRDRMIDNLWIGTGLSDDLRPPDPEVTVISPEEWAFAYVKCMFVAGYEDYETLADGGYTFAHNYEDRTEAEILADFVCSARLEIEGQYETSLNDAQLDFVFDYYMRNLVPCLALQGFEVVRPPTREEFIESFGSWHPYYGVQQSEQEAFYAADFIPEVCPPMPDGVPDPGYGRLWEYV